jgi:hypothetical protein
MWDGPKAMKDVSDLLRYRIPPSLDNGSVRIVEARVAHRCAGGENRTRCNQPIAHGDFYVSYSRAPYVVTKHHPDCAVARGLLQIDGPLAA